MFKSLENLMNNNRYVFLAIMAMAFIGFFSILISLLCFSPATFMIQFSLTIFLGILIALLALWLTFQTLKNKVD